MNKNEKLNELFQNPDFLKEAASFKTVEDFQAGFASFGLEMSEEEVIAFCGTVAEQTKQGELVEDELENVAGGFGPAFWIGVGCVAAACIGIYNGYRSGK